MRRSSSPGVHDYWMSYSDLMAGLLLVFIVLLIGTILAAKIDIETQRQQLVDQQKELQDQEQRIKQQSSRLLELQDQARKALQTRAKITERLRKTFEGRQDVTFDVERGTVTLGSRVLFAEGSATLTAGGKRVIAGFIEDYFDALLGDEELRPYVDQIIFEGHTNSNFRRTKSVDEGYLFNLELSQARAYSAMEFVIEEQLGRAYSPRGILAAIGYSSSRPVLNEAGEEDEDASRRLEVRFRLKDEIALVMLSKMFIQ